MNVLDLTPWQIDRHDPIMAESFMGFAQKCAREALGYDLLRDGPL
jgi:hypothetical protein